MPYKYCLVPCCTNTTINSVDKLFFNVPKDQKKRNVWIKAMKRDENKNPKLSNKTSHWCCEDHFSIKEDMENYWQWNLTKDVKRLQLKAGVVPHIFECQKKNLMPLTERTWAKKRKHMELIKEALSATTKPSPFTSNFQEEFVDILDMDVEDTKVEKSIQKLQEIQENDVQTARLANKDQNETKIEAGRCKSKVLMKKKVIKQGHLMAEQDETKADVSDFQDIKIEEEEIKLEIFEDEIKEEEMDVEEEEFWSFDEEKLQRIQENDAFKETRIEAERCVNLGRPNNENFLLVDFKVNQTYFKEYPTEEGETVQASCRGKDGTSNGRRSLNIKLKSFQCNTCECCFDHKYQLENHVASFHGKDKPFNCSDCGYSCSVKGHLIKHISSITSIHKQEKLFKCIECDYSFSEKGNLTKHIRSVHQKVKPFKCTECGYSCSWIDVLTLHIRSVHKKEKLFKRAEDDYSCSTKGNLITHINVAENILFSSSSCSTYFTEKLFKNFDAFPGSYTPFRSQSDVINEIDSLGTHVFDVSDNISNHKLQKDFLLRSDLVHTDNHVINYSQASRSSNSQFSEASYPPLNIDFVSENDQAQTSVSNWSPSDLNKSDYDDDTFSVNSLPLIHESAPSPSPFCVSGTKIISLKHLNFEEKLRRIRDQNNVASREYRQRKKNMIAQVSDEFIELSKHNIFLKQCVENLQNAVDRCKKELGKTLEPSRVSFPKTDCQWPS